MTSATWRGTNSAGMAGGLAPSTWGSGGRTGSVRAGGASRERPGHPGLRGGFRPSAGRLMRSPLRVFDMPQRADGMLQMPLQVRGDQAAALYLVAPLRRVGLGPVPAQQRAH